jgi:hypothetical protein
MNSFQHNKDSSPNIVKYIFYTGFWAGQLDISASFIDFLFTSGGRNPVIVLNFIANEIFGQMLF